MLKRLFTTAVLLASLLTPGAAKAAPADSLSATPKFNVRPTGRVLVDGALYCSPQKDQFADGLSIPEVRLGARMDYGRWKACIDVGFAYGKVGLKDLYIEYDFNERNLLRAGSFIHFFGLQSGCGASSKSSMEEPVSNTVLGEPRQLGVMYEHSAPAWLATASFVVEPSSTTVILDPTHFNREGFGLMSRLVARPVARTGSVLQAGISGAFATPQRFGDPDSHDAFTFKAMFPTSVARVTAVEAQVTGARNYWKLSPELLLASGRVALESQYYWTRVSRKGSLGAYTSQGVYAILRGVLIGSDYAYRPLFADLAQPGAKSLEAVANYSFTDLNTPSSRIWGGKINEFSLTLNYYFNKYFLARLHYGYIHTWGRRDAAGDPIGSMSLNVFALRLQVLF